MMKLPWLRAEVLVQCTEFTTLSTTIFLSYQINAAYYRVYEYILEGKKRKKNKAHELKPKFLARLPNILKKKIELQFACTLILPKEKWFRCGVKRHFKRF
jgi:hypothetical protein